MSDMLWTRAALDGTPGEDRSIDVIASTEAEDAHETRIRQNWNLQRYLANPVVLWSHDSDSLPIGTASQVRVEGGQLKARVTFSTAELNPMAEQVLQNVRAGVVKGVSVGFCPENVFEDFSTEGDGDMIYVLDAPELFEISICPVPSNPETLAQLRSRAVRAAVPYKAFPADDKSAWDASAAVGRVRKWASSDGSGDIDKIDFAKYREAFAWYDAKNADVVGSYKLPHHDVVGGKLVTIRGGVIAAGNAMQGSRGGVDIPDGDVSGVKSHLAKHYAQFDMKAPWENEKSLVLTPSPIVKAFRDRIRIGASRLRG